MGKLPKVPSDGVRPGVREEFVRSQLGRCGSDSLGPIALDNNRQVAERLTLTKPSPSSILHRLIDEWEFTSASTECH